ncbi:MAG: rhodanese-like domain-containing protein [Bacillota bacterium]
MDQLTIVAAAALGLYLVFRIIQSIRRISPKKALALQASGASVVDVRQPSEYSSGHIKGAVNIPLDSISKITGKISKDTDVIVYCLSGARSGSAARQLKSMGYKKVHDLGSIGRWPYSKA